VAALLGPPNAGKSTLLNALLGEKLAIVTARPQTTRSRMLGILTRPEAQILLLDTPGVQSGQRPLEQAMREQVDEARQGCDVALLVAEPRAGWSGGHEALLAQCTASGTPVLAVANKSDLPGPGVLPWPPPGIAAARALRVSSRRGDGLEALIAAVVALLPRAPRLYPEDDLSDRPLRFLAAERVREAAFEELSQELPYAIAVEVLEFQEAADPVRIRADLLVEREGQRAIAIGQGGRMIRAIGTRARREIEQLLGRRVHLELWVKVDARWSRKPSRIKQLGYF
jgi:GTP-binding protein Era